MTANFGNSNDINAEVAFDSFFAKAGIGVDQEYYTGFNASESLTTAKESIVPMYKELIAKASPSMDSSTGGTYTGYTIFPPFLDPIIVDRTIRQTPLVFMLPRRAVRGRSIVYSILSAKGGASFKLEDAPQNVDTNTRSTGTATIKFLYAVGRMTGVAIASQTIFNMQSEEIRVTTASMNEALENSIINGTSADANGFGGLIDAISTNTETNSGAEITLADIRDDLNTSFEANGMINLIVTDGRTHNYIKGLLQDYMRNTEQPTTDMKFGIPDAFYFDGVLFIRDRYMPTTAASRRVLYLDTRYIYLAVLQEMTMEELAKVNDSRKFMIKWYGTMVTTFESSSVMRYGLA